MKKLLPCSREKRTKKEGELFLALLFFLLAYALLRLGQFFLGVLFAPWLGALAAPLSLLGTAAVFLPILLYARLFAVCPLSRLYIRRERMPLYGLIGLGLGIFAAALLLSLLLLLGGYEWGGMQAEAAVPWLLLLLVYLVQGSAEELLCRGLLLSVLCERFGGLVASLVSAALFALLHIFNPAISLLGFLNILLFGLLFSVITVRTRSVAAACGMHAGWNFAVSLCGVQVSGQSAIGIRFSLKPISQVLTGGAFGPEGSPVLTGLLALALGFLVFFWHFRPSPKHER